MSSLNYDSAWDDSARGAIDFDSDTFKALLTTNSYVPNKGTHTKRSDITNEVSGTGYSAGGTTVTCTVNKDTGNHKITYTFSNPSWASSTITAARYLVIYKSRGGASSADELVCVIDFGADVSSSNGTFSVTISTPMTLQN